MKHCSKSFLILSVNIFFLLLMPSQEASTDQNYSLKPNQQSMKMGTVQGASKQLYDCLPEGFQLSDIVVYGRRQKEKDENITIEDRLIELKARCLRGKLINRKGVEIKFFKYSCFGNPPENYEEIARKERDELANLQRHFAVIILECNPRMN